MITYQFLQVIQLYLALLDFSLDIRKPHLGLYLTVYRLITGTQGTQTSH